MLKPPRVDHVRAILAPDLAGQQLGFVKNSLLHLISVVGELLSLASNQHDTHEIYFEFSFFEFLAGTRNCTCSAHCQFFNYI